MNFLFRRISIVDIYRGIISLKVFTSYLTILWTISATAAIGNFIYFISEK